MCLKGKKTAPMEPGNYMCAKCGATAKDKDKLCKPEKIKAGDGKGKKGEGKADKGKHK